MKYLFYFWGILIVIYEFFILANLSKYKNFLIKVKSDHYKGYSFDVEEQRGVLIGLVLFALFGISNMIWMVLGLFTENWWLFGIYFGITLIHGLFSKIFFKTVAMWNIMKFIDCAVTIALILFMIVNTFHLHYKPF